MRKKPLEQARRDLDTVREKRGQISGQLAEAESRLVRAAARRGEVDRASALAALGELPAKQAEALRAEVESEIQQAEGAVRALTLGGEELEGRIAAAEQHLMEARQSAGVRAAREANERKLEVAGRFAADLGRLQKTMTDLIAARAKAADAEAALRELGIDEFDFPRDEPEWGEVDGLVALLRGGAKWPDADAADAQRRRREEVSRSEHAQIRRAVASGSIPPGTAKHVRQAAEEVIAEEARRREAAEDRTWARVP